MQLIKNRKSISAQLSLLILMAVIVSVCIFFVLNFAGNKVIYTFLSGSKYVDKQNSHYAEELQEYVYNNDIKMTDAIKLDKWAEKQRILFFEIYQGDQWVFSSSSKPAGKSSPGDDVFTKGWHKIKFADGKADVDIYGNYTYRFYYYALAVEFVICFVVFMIITLLAIRKMIQYIKQLKTEIEILEGGNLNYHVTVNGNNELAELATSLECMRISFLSQIENENELKRMNNKIINDLSHDIRTPLTTLMIYSDAIRHKKYKNEDELVQYSQRMEDKINQMKYLTDTIFEYSLKNERRISENVAEYTFEDVFFDGISGMIECLEQSGYSVDAEVGWPENHISVFTEDIDRILNNIASNIFKYADKSATVHIKSISDDGYVGLSFKNTVCKPEGNDGSTKIGISNIKELLHKIGGRCETEEADGFFVIRIFFRKIYKEYAKVLEDREVERKAAMEA